MTIGRIYQLGFKKLSINWNYYKSSNQNKKYLLFNYLFWVLFYRRIICNFLAFPLLILYFFLFPFIKIRFIKLIGSALGHFSVTTELLLTQIDNLKNDKFINIFYIEHSLYETSICNEHLYQMWKRILWIMPLSLSGIIIRLDKMIMFFFRNKAYDIHGIKTVYEQRWVRDPFGNLKTHPPHLSFTKDEHTQAQVLLEKLNIKKRDRYICLFLRTNAYNKGHPTWHYPERNVDINTYMKACHFLADRGYYVLRMGKIVDDFLSSNHPNIIDYARSSIRSDFMDIYLSAHCYFFITTGSGLDGIPQIFRKPILYTNCFILPHIATWYPHYLFTSKQLLSKTKNKLLSFEDQIYYFHNHPEFIKRNDFHISDYVDKNGLQFIDNSDDELLEVVIEMEARMNNKWIETEQSKELQAKFWELFNFNITLTAHQNKNKPLHGDIFIKIGTQFLEKYQYLLSTRETNNF